MLPFECEEPDEIFLFTLMSDLLNVIKNQSLKIKINLAGNIKLRCDVFNVNVPQYPFSIRT